MKTKWISLLALIAISLGSCLDVDDPNAQLNEEIKKIDAYLASMGVTDEVLYDNSSGIRLHIHGFGMTPPPHKGQRVRLSYTGVLLESGNIFDAGELYEKLEDIKPNGLQYSLTLLLGGTSASIYIPSKYGFGNEGTSTVPPNSILVYQVSIVEIERTDAEEQQFASDIAAIEAYLEENSIVDAIEHPSGIRYTIETPGSGGYPTPYSTVTFDYTLRLLSKPTIPHESGTLKQNIFGLIDGLRVGLPTINVGTTATFYIPSGLAYGSQGQGTVPKNEPLIFEIKLTSIN